MEDIIVRLKSVSKKYEIRSKKQMFVNRVFSHDKVKKITVLKDLNLTINKGQRIGIFGPNGSGKTTLINLISGISQPTKGKIVTSGKIMSISDLEAGFHPELTGEENVYLNGIISGMSKSEITSKYNEIIKFADIGSFIDAPFYTYSSGMKFRLAFSVAMASECDMLLIDEFFVMGDVDFQRKTSKLIKDLQEKKKITTLVSSHIPLMIWSFADTFYYVDKKTVKRVSKSYVRNMIVEESNRWERLHVDYRKI